VRNAATLFVPCHRILRRGGGLGGYRWGLEIKEHLLELEASWRTATHDTAVDAG
jgi:methylated-DNA-[protein]-cysteine S-methyltransferase